jgi:hypothetical protein
LKPRLHKHSRDGSGLKNGRLKLRYFIQSAEADIVCVDAVSTIV